MVQLRYTLATLGLPRLSDILEKGANPIRVLEIIRCTTPVSDSPTRLDGERTYMSRMTFDISANRNGS